MGDSRDDLLGRIVADVARHGLADRSLRDLATAVGSSHRMLLYHFGSHAGLVTAIVQRVEAEQRALMATSTSPDSTVADVMRALWGRVTADEVRPLIRLFFEAVAYAGRGESRIDMTGPWLDDAAALAAGLGIAGDPAGTRLGIAVVRGLLIDVVAGGQVEEATRAFEQFLVLIKDFRP